MIEGIAPLANLIAQRWPHLLLTVLLLIVLAPSGFDPQFVGLLNSAQVAIEADQTQAALEALDHALRQHPRSHQLLPLAAEAALRSGEVRQAVSYLRKMDELGIGADSAACQWARVHLIQGDLEALADRLRQASSCTGALTGLKLTALDALEEGNWDRAEQAANLALDHGLSDSHLEYLLIQLQAARAPRAALDPLRTYYATIGTHDAYAFDLLEALREAAVTDDLAFRYALVGQVFARHNRWQLASLAFGNAVHANPNYTQARAYYGFSLERTGQNGKEVILEAFQRDPNHPLPLVFLANLLLEEGRTAQARSLVQRAQASDPHDPVLLVQLAAAQASDGDLIAARGSLVRAVEMAPQEPDLWLALAHFSLQWEIELQELGVASGRQALLLDPDSARALDLLGYAHLLRGSPTLATRLLRRAVHADPQLTSAWYHLGLASLEIGDTQAARSALERAQAIEPVSPTTELARRALVRLP